MLVRHPKFRFQCQRLPQEQERFLSILAAEWKSSAPLSQCTMASYDVPGLVLGLSIFSRLNSKEETTREDVTIWRKLFLGYHLESATLKQALDLSLLSDSHLRRRRYGITWCDELCHEVISSGFCVCRSRSHVSWRAFKLHHSRNPPGGLI